MKCVLLFLTFVAASYSYPYVTNGGYGSGRNININEDGTIVITGANGKRIMITRGTGTSGQRNVDIAVSGPNIPTKRIQINEQNQLSVNGQEGEYNEVSDDYLRDKRSSSKKQRGQGDTLARILTAYQGDVDQDSYQRLLNEINTAVQSGQLNASVYDILQSLNQAPGEQSRLQSVVGQRQGSILDLLREQSVGQQLQQEQQLEQLLQQQQSQRVPVYVTGQQTQYPEDRITNSVQDVVLDVPRGVNQQGGQIVERIVLSGPQGTSYQRWGGLGSGIRGQQGVGGLNIGGVRGGRTLWRVTDLLAGYGTQQGRYGQQFGPIGQSVSGQLSGVIQEEREILDQQRQIQLQQLQQQEQQQQLLERQLLQQQQLEEQQQLLQQLQQLQQLPGTRRSYLLNDQVRGQQGLWQQQPGVYPQGGLFGGYGQGIPVIQRYNVPLVL